MRIGESFNNAWTIISRNKIRSFLTMLGIIIGVMSVIVIISAGAGAQSLILSQFSSLGSDLVGVLPGKSEDEGPPASVLGVTITTLKEEDGQAILEAGNPNIVALTGYVKGIDTVTWGYRKTDTTFVGVTEQYPLVENVKLSHGRFFSDLENRSIAKVAVLGSDVAKELFGDSNPVGEKIKIKKSRFTIIGVIEPRGVSGFQNQDNQIFVPLSAAQKLLLGIDYVSFMRIKLSGPENLDETMDFITRILRNRHGINKPEDDDFSVRSMAEGVESVASVTNALRMFLAAVAGIALIVGGVGIMNIMLAAVQERTREIGLRKAIGAKKSDILKQFLVETCAVTLLGGLIGIVLGVLISYAIYRAAVFLGYDWEFSISLFSVVLAVAVSVGIGFLFGLLPAKRAGELDPITALQYE